MLTALMTPQDMASARRAFIRGSIASGLMAATEYAGQRTMTQATARRALKSGLAVASGTMVVNSLERGDLLRAALFMGGGAVCMATIEALLQDRTSQALDALSPIPDTSNSVHSSEDISHVQ